ncbi:MAG: hypothetical protein RL324_2013 [Verrucomicrobiota bacterium]|jgi:hypothetical protein
MNRAVTPKEITAGYALAVITLCLGLYLGIKVGREDVGSLFLKGFYLMALLIVLKYTFSWGHQRGFPVADSDGRMSITNVLRNLVMTAIVWGLLLLVSAPLAMLAVRLAQ